MAQVQSTPVDSAFSSPPTWRVVCSDVRDGLRSLPSDSFQCVVTSPPYFQLRDYGVSGQIGLEATPQAFVSTLVEVFSEIGRVLRPDGVLFVNLGDNYAGSGKGPSNSLQRPASSLNNRQLEAGAAPTEWASVPQGLKPKDLCLIPERFALAMQESGWYVRSRIAWCKTACMPESVTDRPTNAWEHIWLFSKSRRYYWDADAVRFPLADGSAERYDYAFGGSKNQTLVDGGHGTRPIGMRTATNGRNLWSYWEIEDDPPGDLVWKLGPEPFRDAHFATFPTEIPRLAISAGTSEKGCCPNCGAPWQRLVHRAPNPSKHANVGTDMSGGVARTGNAQTSVGLHRNGGNAQISAPLTIGWVQSCECPKHNPVPCTVLDPFTGSGTTGMVAMRLGRSFIGIELNPEFAEMARNRIRNDAPLLNSSAEVTL